MIGSDGLSCVFIMTDFTRDIEVKYTGATKLEFKEGEIVVLNGFIPDMRRRGKMIALDYMTKHTLETENWEGMHWKITHWNFGAKQTKEMSGEASLG
jgi:cytochrome c-type biogenesis protein CcmE